MIKRKRKGVGLEMRTFHGEDGSTYLVFRTSGGAYHVFVETEAKQAALHCGASDEGNTRSMWASLWKEETE